MMANITHMVGRILLIAFILFAAVDTVSAGVMISDDLQIDVQVAVGMSVDTETEEPVFLQNNCRDAGLAVVVIGSSIPAQSAITGEYALMIDSPSGELLRLQNTSLPPSPFLENRLKPA
jgi:hypothetical protein